MVIRRAYFRKYSTGAFKKVIGWGANAEEALYMAMQRALFRGLMDQGYSCVGGEDVDLS